MSARWEAGKEILGGLAILIGVLAVVAALLTVGYLNNQKVQDMTTFCVEQGYVGWSDDDSPRCTK